MAKSKRFFLYDSPHGKRYAYRREYKGQQLRKRGFETKSEAEAHLRRAMTDIDARERGEIRSQPTARETIELHREPRYQGEEWNLMLARLNAVAGGFFHWQRTVAKREHTDEFGDKIKTDETYYSRALGGSWHKVLRVSSRSMDSLMFSFFEGNPWLLQFVDSRLAAQDKKSRSAMEQIDKFLDRPSQ